MKLLIALIFIFSALMPHLGLAAELADYSHLLETPYKILGTPNIPLERLKRIEKIVSACYGAHFLQSIEVVPTKVKEMVVPWFYEKTRFKSYMVRGSTYTPGNGSAITDFIGRAATTTWFEREKMREQFKFNKVVVHFNPYFYDDCSFQIDPNL